MIDRPNHGEPGKDEWSHARWCEGCNTYHGSLHICENYSQELKDNLQQNADKFKKNLKDTDWIKEQIDNGIPPEVIAVYAMFMG